MSTRAQLEKDIKEYKQALEATKGLPDSVTDNNIKYNSSTGRLEYNMPDALNENKFNENLPENQAKDKVFIKYQISKYTRNGRDYKGNNKVLGFMRSTNNETRMDTRSVNVKKRRVFGNNKKEQEGQEVIHTFYVDVSDIVLEKPGRGLKDWAKDGKRFSNADNVYRAKKIQNKIKNAVTDKLGSTWKVKRRTESGLDPRIWNTSELAGRSKRSSNYFFAQRSYESANSGYAKALKKFNNEGREHNEKIDLANEFNPQKNEYARQINLKN